MKKVNLKHIAAIGTCSLCMAMGVGFVSAAEDADSKATSMAATTYVNVRTDAGLNNKVIGVLSPKEAVQVTNIKGGWYQVVYKDQKAYVYQEYLEFEGSEKGEINNGHKTEMEATANVYVRDNHNNSGNTLGVLSPGEKVQVTGKKDGWYKVNYKDKAGYVYAHYLNFIGTKSEEPAKTDDGKAKSGDKLYTTADVNLRTNSTMDARVIRVVPKGTEVSVLAYENGWYRVDYDNDSGCIAEKYLSTSKSDEPQTAEKGKELTTTTAVNMRTNSSMNARVIRTVPAGAKVSVIDYENGWYRVDYDNDSGCIAAQFLK